MFNVTVVGATGLVGAEIVRILNERQFPLKSLTALASSRSVGETVEFGADDLPVKDLDKADFSGQDLAFFAVPAAVAAEYAPRALAAGCRVIDLSGAGLEKAELAVAGLNSAAFKPARLVATPESAALALAVALAGLKSVAEIVHASVTVMLPVSHDGQRGVNELDAQVRDLLGFQDPRVQLYPHQVAFSVLPQAGVFAADGLTAHENAVKAQCASLLELEPEALSVTSLVVPVFYGLTICLEVETAGPVSAELARKTLREVNAVKLADDPAHSVYPLPIYATGQDEIQIGRVRNLGPRRLGMFIAVDNLRRGSALNAVELAADMLIKR